MQDYRSAVSAYLSLKKATLQCHHPTVVQQQKTACAEEVELAQSHLATVRTELDALQERHKSVVQMIPNLEETLRGAREAECQLKRDADTKLLELQATESEVDLKSKTLAYLELVPNLSSDDAMELERHKQAMPDIFSLRSILICGWIVPELVLSFFLASSLVLMFAGQ